MGVRKNKDSLDATEENYRVTAVREMAKAFYSIVKKTNNKIFKITILPSGDSMGFTSLLPGESEVS